MKRKTTKSILSEPDEPKRGRPFKVGPLAETRIAVYVTADELDLIKQAAGAADQTVSTWCRMTLRRAAARHR